MREAVVLAGGRSTRMGREKSLVDAGGTTLVERLIAVLAPRFDGVLVSVSCGGPSAPLGSAIERASGAVARPIEVVPDLREGAGPLAGVEACLEALEGPRALFVAVDMPDLAPALIEELWAAASLEGRRGAVPRWSGGLEPACAVYAKTLLPDIRVLFGSGQASLHALAELDGIEVVEVGADGERLFRNLNTPEEVEGWRRSGE